MTKLTYFNGVNRVTCSEESSKIQKINVSLDKNRASILYKDGKVKTVCSPYMEVVKLAKVTNDE